MLWTLLLVDPESTCTEQGNELPHQSLTMLCLLDFWEGCDYIASMTQPPSWLQESNQFMLSVFSLISGTIPSVFIVHCWNFLQASVGVPNVSARQKRRQRMAGEAYPYPLIRRSSGQSKSGTVIHRIALVNPSHEHYQPFLFN